MIFDAARGKMAATRIDVLPADVRDMINLMEMWPRRPLMFRGTGQTITTDILNKAYCHGRLIREEDALDIIYTDGRASWCLGDKVSPMVFDQGCGWLICGCGKWYLDHRTTIPKAGCNMFNAPQVRWHATESDIFERLIHRSRDGCGKYIVCSNSAIPIVYIHDWEFDACLRPYRVPVGVIDLRWQKGRLYQLWETGRVTSIPYEV